MNLLHHLHDKQTVKSITHVAVYLVQCYAWLVHHVTKLHVHDGSPEQVNAQLENDG